MNFNHEDAMEKLKYPLGRFEWKGEWSEEHKQIWIGGIAELPSKLRQALEGLAEWQLDTPYRPGGWTVRQVVHHLADSHMNSLTRFKLALTEEEPAIKPYREDLWAELGDAKPYPVEASLRLLEGLHDRWVALLQSMNETDYMRIFYHPESKERVSLQRALAVYDWHGRHHTAHIRTLRERSGW